MYEKLYNPWFFALSIFAINGFGLKSYWTTQSPSQQHVFCTMFLLCQSEICKYAQEGGKYMLVVGQVSFV